MCPVDVNNGADWCLVSPINYFSTGHVFKIICNLFAPKLTLSLSPCFEEESQFLRYFEYFK